MVSIISRSAWGARPPRSRSTTTWSRRVEVTVHYSQGPTTQTPRQIQDYHMDSNGWADIGYNFLVDNQGNAYEGRGWLVIGAHAAPRNTEGIGVCFIGRDGDATSAAKRTIRALYDDANHRAGRTLAQKGHRDINPTSCPGDDLYAWVKSGMPVDGEPPPDTPPWPGVYLRYPPITRHSSVTTWQSRMRYRGWRITVDGAYGPKSKNVCVQFQREKRLLVDGIVGPQTWRATWEAPITP
ncbi:peptidoglycan-binding domain-containing protein [Nocardiopsis gilva YIM 90087]|uniref:Peptidoglycan-binding domain-containing protein n=1 Tax=Nocardiopsis gilva YIM 90087 TaxID=1235441 RepID=A0A223S2S1_9ACTN|nr:peptidoglycan-binding domain-containing protein [Nocardiopsis gilva]ASU82424.1 peptidoglycan-binding domain-containing protein [Nocardiopsis gilva YIM 90087]